MTTAAQALEALNTLADAAMDILWTERCLELSQSVRQHIESTAAELEAMRKDAERYRLVRRGQHWSVINGIGDVLRAEGLDAAVDAALNQGGK